MGIIQYTYDDAFPTTLEPQIESQFDPDQRGSACWSTNTKIPFKTTVTGFQTAVNTSLDVYIEYLDNQTGYLRLEYDNNNTLTDTTLVTYTNDNSWKSVTIQVSGRMNNIISEGDFQIFSSTSENTTASVTTTVRKVSVNRDDIGSYVYWQTQGLSPVSLVEFNPPTQQSSIDSTIEVVNPPQYKYGMYCVGGANVQTSPLYIKIGKHNSSFWRDNSEKDINIHITYFNSTSEDITVSYYNTSGETSKTESRSNSQKWETSIIIVDDIKMDGDYYDDSDIKISTANASELYISEISVVSNDTLSTSIWKP